MYRRCPKANCTYEIALFGETLSTNDKTRWKKFAIVESFVRLNLKYRTKRASIPNRYNGALTSVTYFIRGHTSRMYCSYVPNRECDFAESFEFITLGKGVRV